VKKKNKWNGENLSILSLGGGVQSSALYLAAAQGEMLFHKYDMPDLAIFADTQAEPQSTYDTIDELEKLYGDRIPIDRVTAGNLEEVKPDFASIPFFRPGPKGRQMMPRQCTSQFKVEPIIQHIRKLVGAGPRQHVKEKVVQWIGISWDEAIRAKNSPLKWLETVWPLLEKRWTRGHCLEYLQKQCNENLVFFDEIVKRSACVFCPFKSDTEWEELQKNPLEWDRAVAYDEKLRNLEGGENYLHSSCKPLKDVRLDTFRDQMLLNFNNECHGMCGN